jgi:hypothetical protein
VEVLNQDPRRGPEQEYPLDWINLEAGAVKLELNRQHVTPDRDPQGQAVLLQRNGNMAIDCPTTCTPTWLTTPCWPPRSSAWTSPAWT